MALINIFTPKAPTFNVGSGVLSFDAVLEDTIEGAVTFPEFPLEIGANATDHGVINPIAWTITGLVSNTPFNTNLSDATGFLTNFFDSGTITAVAGLAASLLAGSNETRGGSTLNTLFGLMYQREPFDVDAGDIQLSNMVITNIRRTKTPENEGGLEFVAELQELPLISTVITANQPGQSILRFGDPAQTQATSVVRRGEIGTIATIAATAAKVASVL